MFHIDRRFFCASDARQHHVGVFCSHAALLHSWLEARFLFPTHYHSFSIPGVPKTVKYQALSQFRSEIGAQFNQLENISALASRRDPCTGATHSGFGPVKST
jgi:hypothetical protein